MQEVSETQAPASTERSLPFVVRFFQLFESLGVLFMLIIVLVIMAIIAPAFFVPTGLTNLVITASITAVAGFGMTLAIALGGLDLSVGSEQVLTAIVAAYLVSTVGIVGAIAGALATGLAIGCVNGLVITKLRVPAFVATLGMMGIARGVALIITNGAPILLTKYDAYTRLNGKVSGIPVPFLIALVALFLFYMLLRHTPFGRHVCAVGGNLQAAITSGISVDRVTIVTFMLVGFTAAVSGIMLSAKLAIVNATLGVGFELQVIAITVLGGTSLSGGSGNMVGTMIAAILLASITSALNILRVSPYYQYMAYGMLLIFALALDTVRRDILTRALTRGR